MQRIETATAVPDLHGPGKSGFTSGNPLTGVPATTLSASMWNSLQEELAGIVEAWLGPLDPARYDQLRLAIAKRITDEIAALGIGGKVSKSGDTMSGALAILAAALQLTLQHSDNTATLKDHLRLFRGSGAGTRAALQSLGDAANGLNEIDLNFLSAANAVVAAFKFKNSGRLELGAGPTQALEAATKGYVDGLLPAAASNAETLALAIGGKYVSPANLGALFAKNITTNGYITLPGGLILQWGNSPSVGPNGASVAITFPITFPSAVIYINQMGTGTTSGGNANQVITTKSTTGFTLVNSNTGAGVFMWFALGF